MNKPQRILLSLLLCLPCLLSAQRSPAPLGAASQAEGATASGAAEGLIHLDVVVTDHSGKPVTGLEAKDFTLLDNGQPSRILASHAFDGVTVRPDPPVEVILLIDTLNLPGRLAAFEKQGVEAFLRQKGGRLSQPVSLLWLSDTGLWTLARTSVDGNALAEELARYKDGSLTRRAAGSLRGESLDSLAFEGPPGLTALKALGGIAAEERRKPGRKLLLWVGPGWGMGSGKRYSSSLNRQQLFDAIHWFSTLMREARLVLYSFSVGEVDTFSLTMDAPITPSAALYESSLKGVQSERQASIDNLDRKVLAVQSGGRVLEPSDDLRTDIMHTGLTDRTPAFDLAGQIDKCVEEASAFYTLSFNPAPAERADEYRDLKVEIGKPGLTARTSTGYYDEPYFYDQPHPAARPVTVEQLRQALKQARGMRDAEAARQISAMELTERLSDAELLQAEAGLPGKKARQALIALADASEFSPPPAAEIPADAPPDLIAQKRMISLAFVYLSKTIPRLPNFSATRTTTRYVESPAHYDSSGTHRIDYETLHFADISKATVLYRNGTEVVDFAASKHAKRTAEQEGLITRGTFGPVLSTVLPDAIAARSRMSWSRWERGARGREAVFRIQVPAEESHFHVAYCCLPDGDGNNAFQELAGYHGEIDLDPVSGAILRLALEADLKPDLPMVRSDIVVEYGPVEIGGEVYICPVKSVSITRWRTVKTLTGLPGTFRTFGPFATSLNDVTFGEYHLFRSEARILPGYTPGPEQE